MPEFLIHSSDDSRLDPFRDLKAQGAVSDSVFVAEGEKLVRRLLASRCETVSIVGTETVLERVRPVIPPTVPVFVVTTPIISELIGYQFHRGVLACGQIPPAATLEELCDGIPAGEAALVVACPELRDPTNLGTIIRTAAGFGARFLIAGLTGVSPWSRRVLRTSMGSVLTLPIVQTEDWIRVLRTLHDAGFESVATVLAEDAEPLRRARFPSRRAIFLGNEDEGLSAEIAAACRRRVTVPMSAGVDSLNVAVAAGIAMYHMADLDPP